MAVDDALRVTPNRETRLVLGVSETTIKHAAYDEHFPAQAIGQRLPNGAPASQNVWYLPDGAWALRPYAADFSRLLHPSVAPGVLAAGDVNKVASIGSLLTTPQLSGFGGGSLADVSHFHREIPDPSNPHDELTADASAYPKVPSSVRTPMAGDPAGIFDNQAGVDRVLASKKVFRPNQAFAISLMAPTGHWPADTFFNLYFGGPTLTDPSFLWAGEFALSLRGDGEAVLWERDLREVSGWGLRKEFRWAEPGRAEVNTHVLFLIPHGRDRLALFNRGAASVLPSLSPATFQPLPGFAVPQGTTSDFHQEDELRLGFKHTQAMTGFGPVRLDLRRDYQDVFMIAALDYPPAGIHVGNVFTLNRIPDEGEIVYLNIEAYIPTGTAINMQAYTADTHEACTTVGNGFFTKAGHSKYYVVFELLTSDPAQTPVLFAYSPHMDPVTQLVPITVQEGGQIMSVVVHQDSSGRDLALLEVEDTDHELPYLHQRDGIDARVLLYRTDVDPPTLRSVLMSGRTASVHAKDVQGAGGFEWPTSEWRSYPNLRIQGRWADVARRKIASVTNYAKGPYYGDGPDTESQGAWTTTATIRDLLRKGGVDPTQIDVPEAPSLLPTNKDGKLEFFGNYAADPTPLIDFLVRDVLNAELVRCHNSGLPGTLTEYGPPGMWRLLPKINPNKVLATFWRHTPSYIHGRDPLDADSYLPTDTWVEAYEEWFEAPENTSVTIWGMDEKTGAKFCNAPIPNPGMYDPESPDFSSFGELPFVQDPSTAYPNQAAVDHAARIEFYRRCKGRRYADLVTPLLLVFDMTDPYQLLERPLRKRDVVHVGTMQTVGGVLTPVLEKAVVGTCVPFYTTDEFGDRKQMQSVRVRYLRLDGTDNI